MRYSQENIDFEFKTYPDHLGEFYANVIIKNIDVEFCINENYFEGKSIDWEFVKNFTNYFLKNFDFINKKSQRISKNIYNEYNNNLSTIDYFSKDNCEFVNQILVELLEPSKIFPYPKSPLIFLVDNSIDSPFTYLQSSCIFADYNECHFVGLKATSIQE